MPLQDAPEQDLRVAEPVKPDVNWPAHRKPQFLQIPKGQLDKEHQLVTMRNTDREQVHIIVDRFMVGHELMPGQAKDIDMLADDIKYFMRRRNPEIVPKDARGNPNLHPIVIEGLRDAPEDEEMARITAETAAADAAAPTGRRKLRT